MMPTAQLDISATKKCVSFAPNLKGKVSLHINDYSIAELHAAFYTSEDYHKFKLDGQVTARLIENGISLSEIEFCERGVEHMTKQGMKEKSFIRKSACQAVLAEQEIIRHEEELNQNAEQDGGSTSFRPSIKTSQQERIAKAYTSISAESALLANRLGLADAWTVQQEMKQENGEIFGTAAGKVVVSGVTYNGNDYHITSIFKSKQKYNRLTQMVATKAKRLGAFNKLTKSVYISQAV